MLYKNSQGHRVGMEKPQLRSALLDPRLRVAIGALPLRESRRRDPLPSKLPLISESQELQIESGTIDEKVRSPK